MMNNVSYILKWVGYIFAIIILGIGVFITTIPCATCSGWDYFFCPIMLVVVPAISLLFAFKWPLMAGIVLVAVGLFLGCTIYMNNWVAAFYALPMLIIGLIFISSEILSRKTETSSL